ncbi:hypothetical protein CU097_006877 [Rhizopus azygosporus]|uniref:Kinetochore protein Sos7 coiled-coil domain-containing protein n=1 Tax=Rhizopus azygosporus TaxID=86630 RepID=A0A367K7M5_RHIAZ|nr:hypothetical protein CU097_006877 [Rhizopus azygosporus]
MQETASNRLDELQKHIEQVISSLQLLKYQSEFQQKVKSTDQDDQLQHPKALHAKLQSIKDNFKILQRNYVNIKTKERFLQALFDEPKVKVTAEDVKEIEDKKNELEKIVEEYNFEIEQLEEDVYRVANTIDRSRKELLGRVEDMSKILADTLNMEKEVERIQELASNKNILTIEEANSIIVTQTNELTALARETQEKKEAIEEQQCVVEDLEEEVQRLEKEAELAQAEANKLLKLNAEKNPVIEKEYRVFKRAIDMCVQASGIDKVEYTSDTAVSITFAKPIEATLHISVDLNEDKITGAYLSGTQIPIKDLIKHVSKVTITEGIQRMTIETFARLRSKVM